MSFDLEAARQAGYTDAEIASHLAGRWGFDIKAAKSSGYTDGEVIAHLVSKTAGMTSAPIPGADPKSAALAAAMPQAPKPSGASPTLTDRAVGAGEAALTVATGSTGGTLGMLGGGLGAMAAAILDGSFGTPEAARLIEEAAAKGGAALTYAPRTEQGQEQTAALGKVAQELLPLAGVAPQVQQLARAAAPVRQAVGDAARAGAAAAPAVAAKAAELTQQVARAAVQKVRAAESTPAVRGGSVGAAGAEIAGQRTATADALPVPIRLTRGQATRDFEQLRFEGETAKNPTLGGPLRDRAATQNAQLAQNFEAMIDRTGAQAPNIIETGRTVDKALVSAAARRKAEYRAKYQAADRAGQMNEPVSTAPLVEYIAANESLNQGNLAGGSIGLLQRELVRLGGAEVIDGKLIPRDLSLKSMELLRRQMNNAIDAAPDNATNVRAGAQIKGLIDTSTEGLGGDLYKQARSARRRYAQLFEDNAIVRDLLRTRRGTADRQVALEDVFRRTILSGDRESLSMLRRTLQVAGGEEGAQAWRELQGATIRHLLDESTKGVGTDVAGNPIFSAAKLNNAVRALDVDGRLDFVLSKKGAQTIRDLNEIAKVVTTMPPGSVNTSNTASVLLAAITEAGISGSMTGLPLPVLTGLRQLSVYVKDRKIRQRVQEALRTAETKRPQPGPVQLPENRTLQ